MKHLLLFVELPLTIRRQDLCISLHYHNLYEIISALTCHLPLGLRDRPSVETTRNNSRIALPSLLTGLFGALSNHCNIDTLDRSADCHAQFVLIWWALPTQRPKQDMHKSSMTVSIVGISRFSGGVTHLMSGEPADQRNTPLQQVH